MTNVKRESPDKKDPSVRIREYSSGYWLFWVSLYVLYTLEILVAWSLLIYEGLYRAFFVGLAYLVLVVVLAWYMPMEDRLANQHRLITEFRAFVSGNRPVEAEFFDVNVWQKREGWKLSGYLLVPAALMFVMSDALNGNFSLALRNLRIAWYAFCALKLDSFDAHLQFGRCFVVDQISGLVYFGFKNVVRRSLYNRVITATLQHENLEEILLQMMPISVYYGCFQLAFSMLVFYVIPFELLGFRALLASRFAPQGPDARTESSMATSSAPFLVFFFSGKSEFVSEHLFFPLISIPLGTIVFCFSNLLPTGTDSRLKWLQYAHSVFFAAIALVVNRHRSWVDSAFHPSSSTPATRLSPSSSTSKTIQRSHIAFMWMVTLLVPLSGADWSGTTLLLGLFFAGWVYSTSRSRAVSRRVHRRMLLSSQVIYLSFNMVRGLCGIPYTESIAAPSMAMALIRGMLVFDDSSSLSSVIVELSVTSAIHLLVMNATSSSPSATTTSSALHTGGGATDITIATSVSLISCCALLVALANACASESQWKLYQAIRQSENFLDHAIKQKYSGVGGALEAILESVPRSSRKAFSVSKIPKGDDVQAEEAIPKEDEAQAKETIPKRDDAQAEEASLQPFLSLLSRALHECHMGRDICYMSAVVRKKSLVWSVLPSSTSPLGTRSTGDGDLFLEWTSSSSCKEPSVKLNILVEEWVKMKVFKRIVFIDKDSNGDDRSVPSWAWRLSMRLNCDLLRALLSTLCQEEDADHCLLEIHFNPTVPANNAEGTGAKDDAPVACIVRFVLKSLTGVTGRQQQSPLFPIESSLGASGRQQQATQSLFPMESSLGASRRQQQPASQSLSEPFGAVRTPKPQTTRLRPKSSGSSGSTSPLVPPPRILFSKQKQSSPREETRPARAPVKPFLRQLEHEVALLLNMRLKSFAPRSDDLACLTAYFSNEGQQLPLSIVFASPPPAVKSTLDRMYLRLAASPRLFPGRSLSFEKNFKQPNIMTLPAAAIRSSPAATVTIPTAASTVIGSLTAPVIDSLKKVTTTTMPMLAPLTPTTTALTSKSLPPNLTFAVLDDNMLVRANMVRLAIQHLGANPTQSFGTGNTLEDALFFPHDIVARDVDIAIFDENLDYEPSSTPTSSYNNRTSGTELAKVARQRGFKRCAILHSANGELAQDYDSTLFDGFIEKTSKRHEFAAAIQKIWSAYESRKAPKSS